MDPLIGAGALSFAGGMYSNWQNLAESKRAREWAAVMAGSEVQRRMIDMKAAGLNPILAAGGAASTPSPSTASVEDPVSPAISSALAARAQKAQLKLIDAQTSKEQGQARGAMHDANLKMRADEWDRAKWAHYFDNNGAPRDSFAKLIRGEYEASLANSARSVSDAKLQELSIPERQAVARLFEQVGGGGKAAQYLMPLLTTLINRSGR